MIAAAVAALAFAWAPVPISCTPMVGSPASAWGVYHPASETIEIRNTVCAAMLRYRNGGQLTDTAALGVVTVGHELAHYAGVDDERAADCLGATIARYVARYMGFTRSQAATIAADVANFGYCEAASP